MEAYLFKVIYKVPNHFINIRTGDIHGILVGAESV